MGSRGPAPTPTKILKARGSWRGDENELEPDDAVAAPKIPAGLNGAARTHWKWIVPRLLIRRTLSEVDLGFLAIMCIEYAEYMEAMRSLAKLKKTGENYKGHLIDHPRVVMKGCFDRYSKAAIQFGLSPSAKARVQATPEKTVAKKVEDQPVLRIA